MGRVITLINQHETAAEAEKRQEQARNQSAATENTQASITAAQRRFEAAQREWQASRTEFKALVAGIRKELPDGELMILAAEAGCSGNDLSGLKSARWRALAAIKPAKEFAAAQKNYDRLEKQYREIDARYPLAKNQFESDAILDEIQPVANARQQAMLALTKARVSHEIVEAAKTDGLI